MSGTALGDYRGAWLRRGQRLNEAEEENRRLKAEKDEAQYQEHMAKAGEAYLRRVMLSCSDKLEQRGNEEPREVAARLRAEAAKVDDPFPGLLRRFLWSDAARDVTGAWNFDTRSGDQFREQLMGAVAAPQGTEESE